MKIFSFFTGAFILCSSLFASNPTSNIIQLESEKTEQAAREVVKSYYSEIDRGHYAIAYQLWRNEGASSGKSLSDFTAGFSVIAHKRVVTAAPTDGEGAAGSVYVTIPVRVTFVLKDGKKQRYIGKYLMHRCNDVDGSTLEDRRWHIQSASLRLLH